MASSRKNLEKKQAYVDELIDKIKSSSVGVIISYKGINAKDVTVLRKEMREAEIDYFVVKNTMLRRASDSVGFDFSDSLVGTTAIALSKSDLTGVAKILLNYSKKLEKSTEFRIKTGFADGKVVDGKLVEEIGSLPTKDELIGQLLCVLVAPIRGLAVCLKEIAGKTES